MADLIVGGIVAKAIPGFPGYFADAEGGIWTTRKPSPFMKYAPPPRKMTTKLHPTERYIGLQLFDDNGNPRRRNVHRLVLLAWVGEPDPGSVACHCNGNSIDNRLCNLRWDTPTANQADKKAHGTHICGERFRDAKLTDYLVQKIRAAYDGRRGTLAAFARAVGIGKSAMSAILSGKTYKHLL